MPQPVCCGKARWNLHWVLNIEYWPTIGGRRLPSVSIARIQYVAVRLSNLVRSGVHPFSLGTVTTSKDSFSKSLLPGPHGRDPASRQRKSLAEIRDGTRRILYFYDAIRVTKSYRQKRPAYRILKVIEADPLGVRKH